MPLRRLAQCELPTPNRSYCKSAFLTVLLLESQQRLARTLNLLEHNRDGGGPSLFSEEPAHQAGPPVLARRRHEA